MRDCSWCSGFLPRMHGRGVPWHAPPDAVGHPTCTPLEVRCTVLDTGQGVDTLCWERVRLPALAAVLGAKHLAPTRRTVHPLGRLRAGRDDHQGAVDADVVVKARPGRSQIGAAIERAGVTHGGNAKRSCTRSLRIIPLPLKPATMPPSHHAGEGAISWFHTFFTTNSLWWPSCGSASCCMLPSLSAELRYRRQRRPSSPKVNGPTSRNPFTA